MGFMDELRRLTQPYDDEDDFYEDADESAYEQKFREPSKPARNVQQEFENNFAAPQYDDDDYYDEPEPPRQGKGRSSGGFFGGLTKERDYEDNSYQPSAYKPPKRKNSKGGADAQVMLFNPKNFDDAGELANYLAQGKSLVMALEGIPTDTARRLLDFISGIAFALGAKITPVSAKTYFVTPENVDILDAQAHAQDDEDNNYNW